MVLEVSVAISQRRPKLPSLPFAPVVLAPQAPNPSPLWRPSSSLIGRLLDHYLKDMVTFCSGWRKLLVQPTTDALGR